MAAADARRLHPPVGGEVGRAERQPLHARRRAADLLDVGHAAGGLEDGVHEDRPVEAGLRLELGEQPVDVVDVLGSLDLGDHDHVERVAGFEHGGGQVVEPPRRVEAVDPRPELRVAEVDVSSDLDSRRGRRPSDRPARRPRGWRAGCRPSARCRAPSTASSRWPPGRSGSPGSAGTGSRGAGSGAPTASGRKKSLGGRIVRNRTRTHPNRPKVTIATRAGEGRLGAISIAFRPQSRPRPAGGRDRFRFDRLAIHVSCMRLVELDAVARRHHGVVTREMAGLEWPGVASSACATGLLIQLHPGVARLVGTADTVEQRVTAAVLAIGSRCDGIAPVSDVPVGRVPDLTDDPVDLIVLDRRGLRSRTGICIHRPTDLDRSCAAAATLQHPLHEHRAHAVRPRCGRSGRRRRRRSGTRSPPGS